MPIAKVLPAVQSKQFLFTGTDGRFPVYTGLVARAAEQKMLFLKAAIWGNKAGERTRCNVTFSKRYRDAEGQWKTTQSFGRNDLLVFAKVADQAHSRIVELEQAEDTSGQDDDELP